MNIKIEIEHIHELISAFEQSKSTVKDNMQLALKVALRDVQARAQAEHKFTTRSGNLERSVKKEVVSEWPPKGRVYLDAGITKTDGGRSYGEIIHNGVSHAWTILPRDKQALRWSAGGDFVFSKKVTHKPMQADPFIYQAAEAERDNINNTFNRYTLRALREVGIHVG